MVGESIAALSTSGLTECPLWVISGYCLSFLERRKAAAVTCNAWSDLCWPL